MPRWFVHVVDQKPAALAARHVDRIGELMEADDDDDETATTSDSCRRSVDEHDRAHYGDVGGPGVDAASPRADAGASCVHHADGGIGCHGDGDESDEPQRLTDVHGESPPIQQLQLQQSATGGYSPYASLLPLCVSISVSLRVSLRVSVCVCT